MNMYHFFGSSREYVEVRRIGEALAALAANLGRIATAIEKMDTIPPELTEVIQATKKVADDVNAAINKPI